ncbi:MAG: apolipoprotein N-acyltransferase [Alphaproteobacteria bacterium]|nr:apolipoprotein N-acyltransferase [Alphaproteobacteria bacterium]
MRSAAWVSGLVGWRRILLALLFGAIAALALPPFAIYPLLLVAFTGLQWQLDGVGGRRAAFAVGWAFSFGTGVVGLHWLAFPMLVDAERFAWMIPFAVAGLPALLALPYGLATMAVGQWRFRGWRRVLILALAWSTAEWIRGHMLTGFPWNLIGYSWVTNLAVLQSTALFGIYGLGLVTVLVAAMPATMADDVGNGSRRWLVRIAPTATAAALLLVLWAGGQVRLWVQETTVQDDIVLRLVQPNIPQKLKWLPGQRENNLARHVRLSQGPGLDRVRAVIWPETASSFLLDSGSPAALRVAEAAPQDGWVLTGAPRLESLADGRLRAFNGLVAVSADASVEPNYDKHRLVPFGEYLPLRTVLEWIGIEKLVASSSVDFSPGPGAATVSLAGLPPFSPLICYEAIFPTGMVDTSRRPAWLLSLTNDAWFGPFAGPEQHFAQARVRSIEQGLPLVRVANTGISGVVDPLGRVLARTDLGEDRVLDVALPRPLAPTPYARWGDATLILVLAPLLAGLLVAPRPPGRA